MRVGALGKKGTISAQLATLGKMSPDERKTAGAAINALKDVVAEALTNRRTCAEGAALEARLCHREGGRHPARARAPVRHRPHSSDQSGDG